MSVCSKCLQEIRARQQVITCDSCDRGLHRTCGTGGPRLSSSRGFIIEDIQIDGQRHFVFATTYQLNLLRQTRRWYIDGTFKIVGAPFKKPGNRRGQLFSIHGFVEKDGATQQFPLVFCLMSRQTTADYVKAVKTRLGDTTVEGFVADFEKAEWAAVQEVFPGVEMKGCAFHWSQAVWRRVQLVGLAETYQQRTGMHNFIRRLLSLQFRPAEDIRPAFDLLRDQATTPETQELTRYIKDQWIDSSTFPPSAWSVFRQKVRTNNDVEGWHNRLNGAAAGNSSNSTRSFPCYDERQNWCIWPCEEET